MSVCSPCYDAGIYVDNCASGLTFGTVTPETEFVVSVQHTATRRIQTFVVESSEDGMITIEGMSIDSLQGYTIWLTESGTNEREPISIGGETFPCISFSVSKTDTEPAIVNLTE